MELHVDLSWILEVAERAGQGDPQPDDFGVPIAAVARHSAELLDAPVYDVWVPIITSAQVSSLMTHR
jgi:hypothetical protein